MEMETAQLRQKLVDEDQLALAANAEVQAQVVALRAELAEAREAMAAGHGQEVELRRQMEERLQEEKRKRVEHLQDLGVRRLLHAALGRGWTAWCEMWTEKVRKRNLLKYAGMRLMRPRVVAAYRLWRRDFEIEYVATYVATSKRTTVEELRESLREEATHRQRLQAEVAELLKALGDAGQAILDERARQIGHVQQMSLHRLMHGALSRAWSSWEEFASRRQRQRRLIGQAIGRLARPKLGAAYHVWMTDWSDAEAMRRGARLLEERSAATSAAETVVALRAELAEAREAMAAGHGQEAELRRRMEEELARAKEARIEHHHRAAIGRLLRGALARGWSAWQGQWDEDRRMRRLMTRASVCLVRPHLSATYWWWRREWEVARALQRQQQLLGEAGAQVHAEAQARLVEEAVSARVVEEVALRVRAEEALEQLRVEFEELDVAQTVALVEARKAATDASIGRSSMEVDGALHSSLSSMEKELKRARVAEKAATAAAQRSSDLLYEHQLRAEEKLNRMLGEHRSWFQKEMARTSDEYEATIATLREQLAVAGANSLPARFTSPPNKRGNKYSIVLKLGGRSIAEQLVEQLKEKGVRSIDLYRELDRDADGYLSKTDWVKSLSFMGPELPPKRIEQAFEHADASKSGSVDFGEFDAFLRQERRPSAPPEVKTKPPAVKASKPPVPVESTMPKTRKMREAQKLHALATSMGVRHNITWMDDATSTNVVGQGEDEYKGMMQARQNAFDMADLDKDGMLNFEEFCAMVRYREVETYTDEQLRARFDDMDADGTGLVDLPEFIVHCLRDAVLKVRGRAIDIFRIWDEDQSGTIDLNEFGKAVVALGFVASREDIAKVFNELDEDDSGSIEYKELAKMLKGKGKEVSTPTIVAQTGQGFPLRSAKKPVD